MWVWRSLPRQTHGTPGQLPPTPMACGVRPPGGHGVMCPPCPLHPTASPRPLTRWELGWPHGVGYRDPGCFTLGCTPCWGGVGWLSIPVRGSLAGCSWVTPAWPCSARVSMQIWGTTVG